MNAPHVPTQHPPVLRAACRLRGGSERHGSDSDAFALANTAGHPVAIPDRLAIRSGIALGKSLREPIDQPLRLRGTLRRAERVRLRKRFTRPKPCAVGDDDTRANAVTRGTRSRAGA